MWADTYRLCLNESHLRVRVIGMSLTVLMQGKTTDVVGRRTGDDGRSWLVLVPKPYHSLDSLVM